jgi:hypothetical protein
MSRWRALSGFVTLALLVGVAPLFRAVAASPPRPPGPGSGSDPTKYLEIYYSSPVLVRDEEQVRMPVDVVCATGKGRPCATQVTLATQVGSEPWSEVSVPAVPGLQFDLTSAAARASASAKASVRFFLKAEDSRGKSTMLPPAGQAAPLSFFVTRHLPAARVPMVRFGRVRSGTPVLFLPWGSGRMRAGLGLGLQSPMSGPSGFDVSDRGRVYLVDSLQRRLATFDRGRLVKTARFVAGSNAQISVAPGGRTVAAYAWGRGILSQVIDGTGAHTYANGAEGLVTQVRVVRDRAYAHVLPLDAWVPLPAARSTPRTQLSPTVSVGLPTASGEALIRLGKEDRLRVGHVLGNQVRAPLELIPPPGVKFGEIALAESDGREGYWLVFRVAWATPKPADQYEVLHVRGTQVLSAFATSSHSFAEASPLSRFVLGKDGFLYQMTSSSEGMRIVRIELKEER